MSGIEITCVALAVVALLASTGIAVHSRIKSRRILKSLHHMLGAAMDGTFSEKTFDETMLSSVESKFAGYLSASAVSSRNLADEKDKIKELIADISHQTKTPIANILLYAQLLSEQELPRESAACVSALHGQAEKLGFLITSLVKLSRLETGIFALNPEERYLQPMLDELEAQYLLVAEKKGVRLSIEPTEASAVFDAKWTAEALSNLIDNAIKYTPAGGAVQVDVRSYDLFCRVDVTDTGIGVCEAEQAQIFARFYRSPTVSNEAGVGIGLYLARQILSGQGGYIKVASKLGEGSTFSAFLRK